MAIDVDALVADLKATATRVVGQDVSSLQGFSERQLRAIAEHAEFVGRGIASGEITVATRQFFLDELDEMSRNFARTLKGLIAITVEKLWNALTGVVWKAIEGATGVVLGPR